MKKLILTSLLAIAGYASYAQTNTFQSSGNVGIGTLSPAQPLDVETNLNGTNAIYFVNSSTGSSARARFALGNGVNTAVFNLNGSGYPTDPNALSINPPGPGSLIFGSGGLERMRIVSGGNVGIGTTTPAWPLDVASSTNATSGFQFTNSNTGSSARSRFILNNGTTSGTIIFNGSGYATDPNSLLFFIPTGTGSMIFGTAGTESMRILSNGNLLVGKTTQTNTAYKIDVNGSIRSNSIVVNTTGADFVFAPGYKLSSLATVDRYIQKNHHLPGIASANEMRANGLNVAENQTKLLQKTEELTLYLIEKDNIQVVQFYVGRISSCSLVIAIFHHCIQINRSIA